MISTITVVEDDNDLREYIRDLLLENNYRVETVSDGASALNSIKKIEPSLVVLDLGLPNVDGETVCREVKKDYPELPIIILTARDDVRDIVHGLDLGADDYMTKPFSSEEFLARIKARLRSRGEGHLKLKVGDLELDNQTLEVKRSSKVITLTPQEFKLLEYLMNNKNRILTREMILNRVWGYSSDIETRVVDVFVGYLRKKVDAPFDRKLLHSIRGFGYTMRD